MLKRITCLCLLFISSLMPSKAFAETPQIANGLSWLTSAQTSTGSWPGIETSDYYSTSLAIDAFYAISPASPSYASGLQWLSGQVVSPTDYLSRRILALQRAGMDISAELDTLLLYRNPGGGWGGDSGYGDDILDTVLALQSLRAVNYSDTVVLGQALGFVIANQNADNGWGFYSGDTSNAYSTALVLKTLTQYQTVFNLQSSITKAASYLAGKQNPDGGFGSSPSTIYETSLAFQALLESGQGGIAALQSAVAYLTANQAANGSWNDDPYSTAMALQALATVKPNLAVNASDISYAPSVPTIDDSVTVTAVVRNSGLENASSVRVSFYDGDPASGGALISQTVIPDLAAGGSAAASINWTATTAGMHNVFVLVDPADIFKESSETDNTAVAQIRVYEKVDLAAEGITFLPELPAPGQAVDAQVRVANKGGLPAESVVVRLSVDGLVFADKTITVLGSLQEQTVVFTIPNPGNGLHSVLASVDPDNTLAEGDETNNTLTRSLEVKERIDIIANPAGIHFTNSSPLEGEVIHIAAVLYNARENTASSVLVRLYDGDPAAGGTQIGADQIIATIAGGKTGATEWVPYPTTGKAGRHTVYIVADPLNGIEETDELNNVAIAAFSVEGRPDLTVQDIQFTPLSPEEGDSAQIKAVIKNSGSVQSNATKLRFYLGDPSSGEQIGLDIAVGAINAGATLTTSSITFGTSERLGDNAVSAVIDPLDVVDEISETNNDLIETLTVRDSTRPDLTVAASDISFTPSQPSAGGQVSIAASVRNLRNTPVSNVTVGFYDGNPAAGGILIGTVTIPSLAGMGAEQAITIWNLAGITGRHTVYVKTDPANEIVETNESNNEASAALKVRLPQSAAPQNLTATPATATAIDLAWEPGPDAVAYGIVGYNIYRNELWTNGLRDIAREGTATASSSYSSYTPDKAIDGNINTYWYANYNAPVPQWWQEEFAAPRRISKVAIYWNASYYAKNFEIQTWDGTQWVTQSSVTGNTKDLTVHDLASDATTTAVRIYVTAGNYTYYPAVIREVELYEGRTATGTAYQDAGLGAGNYTYVVAAVDGDGVESLPSNAASASLDDMTPPAAPTGMSATVSGFTVNASWSANAEADLAGYRVYRDGLNVAQRERGAQITATNGSSLESIIDGNANTSGYVQWNTNPAGAMTVALAREYTITALRMSLYSGGDNRFFRYLVESSVDGETWTVVSDKRAGEWRGRQEVEFAQPVQARYFRITGTFCSADSYFRVNEFEAYTSEFAPKTLDTYYSFGLNVTNYSNFFEWTYDWNTGSKQPRRFVFSEFNVEEKDTLEIYDRDTNILLASYSGNLGPFISAPLTAANFRFKLIADYEGTATGFRIAGYLTSGKQTTRTSSETIYQNSSYSYAVTAIDTSGNESALSNVAVATIADTTPPAVPRNPAASAGNGVVSLTWTANNEADLAGYNLYRNNDLAPMNAQLLTATSYKDTAVMNLSTYEYRVAAVDVNGNESAKTAPVTATPTGIDLTIYQSGTAADLFISPPNPTIFETATVTALVKNAGTDAVGNITVNFYDGDPASRGALIGSTVIQKSLGENETGIAQVLWDLQNAEGTHEVYAVIDPDNALPELVETNNRAFRQFAVTTTPILNVEVNAVSADSFPVVEAKVRVRDANDNGVFGLNENNFEVIENGIAAHPVTVTALSDPQNRIPKVDIAFVVDTSGSMSEEWQTLCGVIGNVVNLLAAQGIDLGYTIYGLSHQYTQGDCSTVLSQVIYNNALKSAFEEDWGPGTTWAAKKYSWREGAARIVIPISDENAYGGTPETQEDLNSIQEAIQACVANQVMVYPFYSYVSGTSLYPGVKEEADALAAGTGGMAFLFQDANQVINELIKAAKRSVSDYLITYSTPNPARDGSVRNMTITASYSIASGSGTGQYIAPTDALPDLVAGPVALSNPVPQPGEIVSISAEIENLGGSGAQEVLVRFYDGDPAYGIQLGADQTIAGLPAAGKITLAAQWLSVPGAHVISVVADPLNRVEESREDNNKGMASVTVPGSAMPELGLNSNDIVLNQSSPNKGETVTIQATIHNSGADAQDVLVLFYIGDPANGGTQIGSAVIPDLPANSITTIAAPWPVDRPAGTYDIYVWIDPYDSIREDNETDNKAFRSVTTGEKELALSIATDKPEYAAASDAGITAIVRNDTQALWSGAGSISVEDGAGNQVAGVTSFAVTDLKPSGLAGWAYRVPVTITPEWDLKDALARTSIDFTAALDALGLSGKMIDKDSIRVLEFDAVGNVLGEKQAKAVFRSDANADVTWLIDGATSMGAARYFSVYFDTTEHGSKAPSLNTKLPQTGRLIAYSEEPGNLFVVESNNDGTFGTPRLVEDVTTGYDYTRGIILHDFNGDGFIDIVTGSGPTGDIYYYQNKADGTNTFAPKVKIGTISSGSYIMDAAPGDFNKDGNTDFAISGNVYNQLYLFKGNDDGTFTQANIPAPSGTNYFRGKATADADRDGNLDLIVGTSGTAVYLYSGNGDGTFKTAVRISTAGSDSYGIVSGDFNGDGKADIILNKGSLGDAYLLTGNGDGTFAAAILVPSLDTNNSTALDAGDFNNDGLPDVIAATYSSRTIDFYPGNGDGTFGAKTTIASTSSYPLGISSSPALPEVHPAPGSAENVPVQAVTAVWNTGATLHGSYKAHVTLSEGAGVVADSSAPFAILPDIRLDSKVTTDRLSYNPHEPVTVNAAITSLSVNNIFTDLVARISIADNAGQSLFTHSRTIPILTQGQRTEFKTYWDTATNSPGTYTVTIEVLSGPTALSSSSSAFEILGSSGTGSGLAGTISAAYNPVDQGSDEILSYSIVNNGNENLASLNSKILIVDPATQQVLAEFTGEHSLATGQTITGNRTVSTAGLLPAMYLAVLQAAPDGLVMPRTLASTNFEIRMGIETNKKIPDVTNLLVWVNDHCRQKHNDKEETSDNGQHEQDRENFLSDDGEKKGEHDGCADRDEDREHGETCIRLDLLDALLTQATTSYHVVLGKKDFERELRNPFYTDILVLGDHHPLEGHFGEELREKVNSGTGLISSLWLRHGRDDGRKSGDPLFGVVETGHLPGKEHDISTVQSPITEEGEISVHGRAERITTADSAVIAGWIGARESEQNRRDDNNDKADHHHDRHDEKDKTDDRHGDGTPAIVLNEYGSGRTIYYAFDIGAGLSGDTYEQIAALIKSSIAHVHRPKTTADRLPNELVPVLVEVKSIGGAFDIRLTETYPSDVKLFDPAAGQWITENPWTTTMHLDADETKTLLYYALMPDNAGAYTLKTEAGYVENGVYTFYRDLLLDLAVEKTEAVMAFDAIVALRQFAATGKDKAGISRAIKRLEAVQKRPVLDRHDVSDNIHDLLKAIDALAGVTGLDMSGIRLMLDDLLRVWETAWYVQKD